MNKLIDQITLLIDRKSSSEEFCMKELFTVSRMRGEKNYIMVTSILHTGGFGDSLKEALQDLLKNNS